VANAKFKEIPVNDISLDFGNPRIAQWIEMYKDPTSEDIALALGVGEKKQKDATATYSSLKESIKTHKGLIHPIIINTESDGKLVVIEGNTRVAIIREFYKDGVDGEWETVPSMVYQELSKSSIDAIRLQAHLVGPRQWRPYAKAKYLSSLRNESHLTLSQIIDFCGGQKSEVISYIDAFGDMETHYRPLCDDGEFDPKRFSAFVELQKPIVQTALLDSGYNKDDFSLWIKDYKIKRLERVRDLPRVLKNPAAKSIFLNKNIDEAVKVIDVLDTADKTFKNATIYELAKAISVRISKIGWEDVQHMKEETEAENANLLFSVRDKLDMLCNDIEGT
jgi:hypothetical protein